MLQKKFVVIDPMGLHARPVSILAATVKKGKSSCFITANGMNVDVSSIMMVLTLGLSKGSEFIFKVDGEDENELLSVISKLMKDEHIANEVVEEVAEIDENNKKIIAIAASKGYAHGVVFKVQKPVFEFSNVHDSNYEVEKKIYSDALVKTKKDLAKIFDITLNKLGDEHAQVFKAHELMLEDIDFVQSVDNNLKHGYSAGYSVLKTRDEFVALFDAVDNEYMKERAFDLKDVTDRLLAYISGTPIQDLSLIDRPVVLVAHDLGPSDTAVLDRNLVLGFITEIGGRTSHTSIIARSMQIPAVVGAKGALTLIPDDSDILLDGNSGEVIIDPTQKDLEDFDNKVNAFEKKKEELKAFIGKPAVTKNGKHVEVASNIGNLEDLENAMEVGVDGVGLFRTEFIFMGKKEAPDESFQFDIYKRAVELAEGKPVIFRTLDIGGDKEVSFIDQSHESNPFLGVRGVRLCFVEDLLFRTQIRALLRASAFGYVRIMFPMISTIEEVRDAKKIVNSVKEELEIAGEKVGTYEIGIMIEVPAAAVSAELFAEEVDFFSIGTNDLIQYTMASDRMNEGTRYLYQPFHPSLLRLFKTVIDAAHNAGIWTGMCGSMASNITATPILLGLGLDEFSCSFGSVLDLKARIASIDTEELPALIDELWKLKTAEEIKAACVAFLEK